ncbi:MAG TPA: iron ABC transporter permease, partial [Thermoanaerobaculia bacterium]
MSEIPLAPAVATATRAPRNVRVSPFTKAAAIAIAAFIALPLVYLLVRAAEAGPDAWRLHLLTTATIDLLGSTIVLAVSILALCIAVSVPYAWLVTRTDLPARQLWAVIGALPLAFPSYVAAFTIVSILGPYGAIARALGRELPEIAYGWSGAMITLGLFSYPYLYLLLVAAMKGLDPSLEEAARSLGASRAEVFRRVIVPQLRAPLGAGSLMIVLYTISDFGAVSIVRYDTFTTAIYDAYRGLFDRTVAALLATVLALMTIAILVTEWIAVRDAAVTRSRASRTAPATPLGRWKPVALLFVSIIAFATVLVPLAAIAGGSMRAIASGRAFVALVETRNSLLVSAAAAIVCVVLSLPVALWAVRGRQRMAVVVERVTFAGYALPGIVVALALVFFGTRVVIELYQTLGMLIFAWSVLFLPLA